MKDLSSRILLALYFLSMSIVIILCVLSMFNQIDMIYPITVFIIGVAFYIWDCRVEEERKYKEKIKDKE
jgi:hypothetical protein